MSLTRGGAGVVGLIILVVLITSPTNAPIFIVLAFLGSLLVVNAPYAFLAVRSLSAQREHATHVREGSEMFVRLRITNMSSRSRVLLRFFDRGPADDRKEALHIPFLGGKGTETISYTCTPRRRGVYRFDTCKVESSSPFGLLNARLSLHADSDLVVYPLYYELTGAMFPFHKTFSGMTAAPGSRPGEGPCFFGLREYRPGDPIRKIHWPSTLRTHTVMIKEFEEDMHSSVTILLDSCESSVAYLNGDTNLETAIRVAASLANYTLVNGHPTTLSYFDNSTDSIRNDKTMGDLTPVLDALARLTPSRMKALDLVGGMRSMSANNSNCIVILLSAEREAMTEILRLRSAGIETFVVLVDEFGTSERGRHQAWLEPMLTIFEASGINMIRMAPGDDVQATLSRNLRPAKRVRFAPCSS